MQKLLLFPAEAAPQKLLNYFCKTSCIRDLRALFSVTADERCFPLLFPTCFVPLQAFTKLRPATALQWPCRALPSYPFKTCFPFTLVLTYAHNTAVQQTAGFSSFFLAYSIPLIPYRAVFPLHTYSFQRKFFRPVHFSTCSLTQSCPF